MKYFISFSLALTFTVLSASFIAPAAVADDAVEIQNVEDAEVKSPTAQESWTSNVKTKYALTDEQMTQLNNAGIKGPHLAFTAELAKASGKTVEEITQMRTTEKMGWGAIAKKLGLPPGSIGQSVASLRHEMKENKGQAKKEDKMAAREERKRLQTERKEARKSERAARKEARAAGKKVH